MLILRMTQFDTAKNSKIKKCRIDFQHFINVIVKNIQIPSSTQALTQLIVIQLVGFLVFYLDTLLFQYGIPK